MRKSALEPGARTGFGPSEPALASGRLLTSIATGSQVSLGARRLEGWRGLVKRIVDRVLSLLLLICLSPLLALIAVAIRWDSPGPVIFRQERVGYKSRPFTMMKFRTMTMGASEDLHRNHVARQIHDHGPPEAAADNNGTYKLVADPRVTRVGALLRRTSFDELPQLLNVLRGEMSLVGPRPPLPYEVRLYDEWQCERLSVRPGITGLWQVSGRSRVSYRRMCELDVEYARRWSLMLDLKVLLATIPVVLLNRGRAT